MKQSTLRGTRTERFQGDVEESAVIPLNVSEVAIRKILVGVDFSEGSRAALQYALSLAKGLQAEILLVHVFERVAGELKVLESSFVDTSFRQEAQDDLAEWNRKLALEGVSCKAIFREGTRIGRQIAEAAVETGADLIVIGRQGRRVLDRLLPTTTVRRVLRHAPCPVLIA